MNGRVVDPLLGRFLSADPHVQAPYDPQNLNRYAYALNNPVSSTDPSGYWFLNDVVNWVGGAINTVGNAISDAGKWIGHHAADIGIAIGIAVASVVTFGIADAALGAAGLSALGSSIIAGAISGAVAGGLSSSLLGGGFSWKAVGFGALAGAFGGAAASLTSGLGSSAFAIPARIGISAVGGGLSSWTAAALSGHASWSAFFQGAVIGGLTAVATMGLDYLNSSSSSEVASGVQSSNLDSGSNQNLVASLFSDQTLNDCNSFWAHLTAPGIIAAATKCITDAAQDVQSGLNAAGGPSPGPSPEVSPSFTL